MLERRPPPPQQQRREGQKGYGQATAALAATALARWTRGRADGALSAPVTNRRTPGMGLVFVLHKGQRFVINK